MPYTRAYSFILEMYPCFILPNTFLPLARRFFSGTTFSRWRDFFLSGATFFFAGATFFVLLARIFFFSDLTF